MADWAVVDLFLEFGWRHIVDRVFGGSGDLCLVGALAHSRMYNV